MPRKFPTENVPITDNIQVTVPDVIHLMTPYVLTEQQDWFEDEIKFIRKIITPGMDIVDIGANYGLYTLSMARKTGETGKVLAFEPTSSVADCLEQSITNNNLNNIQLLCAGVSDHTGNARLYLNQNPELNSLYTEDNEEGTYETVELVTLDSCVEKYKWNRIDFIKLDAEGEEVNIIDGGEKTLTTFSPLIMYELKHGEKLNLPLINKFEGAGYTSYFLVPGLNILAPFDKEETFDAFLLNLFCCKEDTAQKLEEEGFLLCAIQSKVQSDIEYTGDTVWKDYCNHFPYASSKFNEWEKQPSPNVTYRNVINCYILSKSKHYTPSIRFTLLKKAYDDLTILMETEETYPRLMTLARIAFEIGQRAHAVTCLGKLINQINSVMNTDIYEPFLSVSPRYETVNPGNHPKEWLASSIFEQYEIIHAFSSYFTGKNSLQILKSLKKLGFQSEEMDRRLTLIQKRFKIVSQE